MRKHVRWSAQELLSRHGFEDGQFVIDYHHRAGALVSLPECCGGNQHTLGQSSHLPGEDYPEYVLCLVEQLCSQGLQYIVLQDPNGFRDNTDTIDSFVYQDRLYIPNNTPKWFATLPPELQYIFVHTTVEVTLDEKEAAAPPSMPFLC